MPNLQAPFPCIVCIFNHVNYKVPTGNNAANQGMQKELHRGLHEKIMLLNLPHPTEPQGTYAVCLCHQE